MTRVLRRTHWGSHLILLLGVAAFTFPFLLVLKLALSDEAAILERDFLRLGTTGLDNFTRALGAMDLGSAFVNSSIVATIAVTSNLVFGSMAGYAFARLRFRGRDSLFAVMLGTLMIPTQVVVGPLYLMLAHVPLAGGNDILGGGGSGLLDSHLGIALPVAVNMLYIFLFRQYFRSIPAEFAEAAQIDGCSPLKTFWHIYLPLARPVLVTVGVLAFLAAWNDLLWPIIVASGQEMWTLQVALVAYRSEETDRLWSVLMAGNVMTFVIPIAVFAFFQRQLVRSVVVGGLRG